jgi:hypothetical protein
MPQNEIGFVGVRPLVGSAVVLHGLSPGFEETASRVWGYVTALLQPVECPLDASPMGGVRAGVPLLGVHRDIADRVACQNGLFAEDAGLADVKMIGRKSPGLLKTETL